MVTEVTAFAAQDGKLFRELWEALFYDADAALAKAFDKEETRNLILNNRETIFNALQPLIQHETGPKS